MKARRVAAIVLRYAYLLRGSLSRLLPIFAWVAIDIVLWGFITKYLGQMSHASVDFVPLFLGAVLMWDFFSRVMHGVTMTFFEDVWSRNFLNLFASPMSIWEYTAGLVTAGVATSAVGLAIMLALATAAFGFSFFAYGAALFPFLLVLFLFGIALGVAGCAMVLRLGPASEWFIWPIPALLSPFAGVFYPISILPGWMQAISAALPPAAVFENMRAIVTGGRPDFGALVFAAALALAYIAAAAWYFAATYRYAVRTGLIARYSAETVA